MPDRVNPEQIADRLVARSIDVALAYLHARLRLESPADCDHLDTFALRVLECWPAPRRPSPDRRRGNG